MACARNSRSCPDKRRSKLRTRQFALHRRARAPGNALVVYWHATHRADPTNAPHHNQERESHLATDPICATARQTRHARSARTAALLATRHSESPSYACVPQPLASNRATQNTAHAATDLATCYRHRSGSDRRPKPWPHAAEGGSQSTPENTAPPPATDAMLQPSVQSSRSRRLPSSPIATTDAENAMHSSDDQLPTADFAPLSQQRPRVKKSERAGPEALAGDARGHSPNPATPRHRRLARLCEPVAALRCAQKRPSGCNRATTPCRRQARHSARRGSLLAFPG